MSQLIDNLPAPAKRGKKNVRVTPAAMLAASNNQLRIFTLAEAVAYTGIPEKTLTNMAKAGRIKALYRGTGVTAPLVFVRKVLDAYIYSLVEEDFVDDDIFCSAAPNVRVGRPKNRFK